VVVDIENTYTEMQAELDLIKNPEVRKFCKTFLWKTCESSGAPGRERRAARSCSQSPDFASALRRSRAVTFFANKLCLAYCIEGNEKDMILATCILYNLIQRRNNKDNLEVGKEYSSQNEPEVEGIIGGVLRLLMTRGNCKNRNGFRGNRSLEEIVIDLAESLTLSKRWIFVDQQCDEYKKHSKAA
jgi:hypothetical protein